MSSTSVVQLGHLHRHALLALRLGLDVRVGLAGRLLGVRLRIRWFCRCVWWDRVHAADRDIRIVIQVACVIHIVTLHFAVDVFD